MFYGTAGDKKGRHLHFPWRQPHLDGSEVMASIPHE